MRLLFVVLAALTVAQCASSDDRRFRVGQSPHALVVIGVAEAANNTSPRYTMLWRRLDESGAFMRYDESTIIEPRTHMGGSVRIRGIPGEFVVAQVEPGVYALDSVFALIRDERVNYSATGVIAGPERASFEVRAGEAIYLGIWQVDLEDVTAVTRPWRLERADAEAVMHEVNALGPVTLRRVRTIAVPCAPHQLNTRSQREIC